MVRFFCESLYCEHTHQKIYIISYFIVSEIKLIKINIPNFLLLYLISFTFIMTLKLTHYVWHQCDNELKIITLRLGEQP
jgi:hypothetical protein